MMDQREARESGEFLDIFSDLSALLCEKNNLASLNTENLRSEAGIRVYNSLIKGGTISKFFCDLLLQKGNSIHECIFGTCVFNFERKVRKKKLLLWNEHLNVCFDISGSKLKVNALEDMLFASKNKNPTFYVSTDFCEFTISVFAPNSNSVERLASFSIEEFHCQLLQSGNIFELCLPSSWSITTRTIPFTLPTHDRSVLFSDSGQKPFSFRYLWNRIRGLGDTLEEAALSKLTSVFDESRLFGIFGAAKSLNSLSNICEHYEIHGSNENSEKRILGRNTIRLISARVPKPINFGGTEHQSEYNQDDIIINYNENTLEYEREFIIADKNAAEVEPDFYDLQFDLIRLMGVRRSGLFRHSFGKRVYSIAGVPTFLRNASVEDSNLVIVPILNLYRVPDRDYFRNTFTLTACIFPIGAILDDKRMSSQPRRISALESAKIRKAAANPIGIDDNYELGTFTISGVSSARRDIDDKAFNISNAIGFTFGQFLKACRKSNSFGTNHDTHEIDRLLFEASLETNLTAQMHLVDWKGNPTSSDSWANWLAGKTKNFLNLPIYQFMYCKDYLSPSTSYTSTHLTKLKKMVLGNHYNTDLGGLTLFDETTEQKCIFFPSSSEAYPKRSIMRWMSFSIFQDSAVSSMKAMVYEMHSQFAEKLPLGQIVSRLSGAIESFGELFDLEIRRQSYKEEYIEMRDRLKINLEYEFILNNYRSLKDSAMLKEQKLFNVLLTSLTIVTLTLGIFSFVGQNEKLTSINFVALSVPILCFVGFVSFRYFDFLRKWLEKK